MEKKYYRINVNFTTTYVVEVRAESLEEAKELAENDALDTFASDWDNGEIDPTYFAISIEEEE